MITVILPWPDPVLFPNAQRKRHWSSRAQAAKTQRGYARWMVTQNSFLPIINPPLRVTYTFHKPDNRIRDLDGCYSAMKSAQDGIADALEIDDRHFHPVTLDWGTITEGGRVVVTIGE